MSLRRRLTLSLVAILVLFSLNVGTHFWGSLSRSESMVAYRDSVLASQLSSEVEQLLEDQRQQILVLSTLRDSTADQLDTQEMQQAEAELRTIAARIRNLGELSPEATAMYWENLWNSAEGLLERWGDFYSKYNDPDYSLDANDTVPYVTTAEHLKELEQRQAFVAVQRANIIDRTIALTDRITVIGFVASIFLTATLGFFLVRYTNSSLKRLKTGTQRVGGGDLNYRIDDFDDKGELGDLASAFNDMAEKLRNAMYDVRRAKDDADEANAAKSIFLANVSHELRTPLNAIIGYSEMLHDELDDAGDVDRPQFQRDLDKIVTSGRQLLTLINDILDLSKIETGKMSLHCETFDPSQTIKDVCDSLAPLLLDKDTVLEVAEMEDLPILYNDATKFRQIFVNLLSNAFKFTERGYIHVSARQLPDRDGWLEFSVRDTGIGMDEEQQSRVFDAFVQASSSTSVNYGGTGLGLAICREFCDIMGGTIAVESELGSGSTFKVVIPSDPALAHAAA
ncbi:MAG: HAMP domain-containing sensor histidine kinase [Pseudomonadota bacterium]